LVTVCYPSNKDFFFKIAAGTVRLLTKVAGSFPALVAL
jgi:hypothetical protein